MKIGIVANMLQDKTLVEALECYQRLGIQKVEIGCGGYPGKSHANPEVLLADKSELDKFKETIAASELAISAFACHGNPIHPDKEIGDKYHEDMCNAVKLAHEMNVDTLTCFSGCAGDYPGARMPNWVTCSWPDDYLKILEYQWNDVMVPYWQNFVKYAKTYGVNKIALEMHPGFMVYNTETLMKLRSAVGTEIGANFDPSHLVWQGMDPITVIRELREAIFHVHAKDIKLDRLNIEKNGVLDTKHYSDEINRSWIFRTVGYGNDVSYWRDIFSALRMVGYDDVISIEHEDSLMDRFEGLKKAVRMVKENILVEGKTEMWWA
ncbi:sugar phosphate isomerase/epimerase family protein [Ohessyouella blattaphilus]|uniref:Sugar phosphate isomerase/epimerase n=1 Tax=Ohessyouella blattaphilus TaxID=2949333 RepID=A0ABT1EKD7_9FIRM|nr:sugar phosphate isomerase/epimerase [Ohessyouella blattaphilus]MCP1111155.1 sugar phosphate isomerase/epimerase [Ohessyouella blattaphilus]MCR8564549.1 sugar phosphate isomerase/epimerase [Ohessyouella blattaphilus]